MTSMPLLPRCLLKLATGEDNAQQQELVNLQQATPTLGPRLDREHWAYRLGLASGLRLARAVGEGLE